MSNPSSVPCLGLPRNRLAARLRVRPSGRPEVLFGRHSTGGLLRGSSRPSGRGDPAYLKLA
ncbi:hypothetical protein TcasGA2_TC031948 [Tribolium castaneum]|uniref:Uncharacterized protein n=1 Tax=Tribolium castaneum TaxID=7070 RepID=A0A139W962_TRICA|nr:hypothetical protein TcasGA2_TC031948 [Tribolium castaneum]